MTKRESSDSIVLSLPTEVETKSWSFAAEFLEPLFTHQQLHPQYIYHYETKKFSVTSLDDCKGEWVEPLEIRGPQNENVGTGYSPTEISRTKAVTYTLSVRHTNVDRFGNTLEGQIYGRFAPDKRVRWLELFRAWCALTRPKFGTLHLFTGEQMVRAPGDDPNTIFRFGPSYRHLARGVPQLAWANYFGQELAGEVDADGLQAAGFCVEEIAGGFLILIGQDIFLPQLDFQLFKQLRQKAKSLFRGDLFLIRD